MANTSVAPYGSWRSPIAPKLIAAGTLRLGAAAWLEGKILGEAEAIPCWLEGRPTEKGRTALVARTADGQLRELAPAPANVRSRVHEYGGGAFCCLGETIYFSEGSDNRIYRQTPGSQPKALTPPGKEFRYADLTPDPSRDRLLCVRELQIPNAAEPLNELVSIDLGSGTVCVLATGSDFYASPRPSPDGSQLAWLDWQHPNMPWDGTQLWVAAIAPDGTLQDSVCIAGSATESIHHPRWSAADGKLYFASDRSGWWNLYCWDGRDCEVACVLEMEAEFAYPHWVFGLSTYDFWGRDRLVCAYSQGGCWHLGTIDLQTQTLTPIETPYANIESLHVAGNAAIFIASSPTEAAAVIRFDLISRTSEVLQRSLTLDLDTKYLAQPQAIAFPTTGDRTAHAWFYPPKNPESTAPVGEKPPLIVKCHSGPTAMATPGLNLKIQYWTSRGFAFLDVNYGGSIGYGRGYRERLDGQWGIVDVDDCVNGARYVVAQGLVDGDRLAMTGSSAGGYTTLAALTFRDVFKAGASYYGISDLEALVKETHKFEARYFDRLVGKYPEEREIYIARSPIHHADRLNCPTIFFQGLADTVVPPAQAEKMVAALQAKGIPVTYMQFPEEGHGFRQAETSERALTAELTFYREVFGISAIVR